MEERMKRVMKFSLLFDDDVDDDDDICFYMRVLCALFMRYVRLKFYMPIFLLTKLQKIRI